MAQTRPTAHVTVVKETTVKEVLRRRFRSWPDAPPLIKGPSQCTIINAQLFTMKFLFLVAPFICKNVKRSTRPET